MKKQMEEKEEEDKMTTGTDDKTLKAENLAAEIQLPENDKSNKGFPSTRSD